MKHLQLDLKADLISKGFIDNCYLDSYCQLIERNRRTPQRGGSTNKHHIVPRCWFKLNKQTIDNSPHNLVNLMYREHVLAHYYLCLCTKDSLQFGNELALICLLSRKKINNVDKQLIQRLPLYNTIYEDYKMRLRKHESMYKRKN